MANEKKKMVSEDELLKALGDLEEHADEYGDDEEQEEHVSKAAKDEDSDESGSEEEEESEDMGKAHTASMAGMPDNTKQANGGFDSQPASEDPEHFETNADEEDPSGASMKSLVEDSDTLRKGFEVSAFLEALTDATVESVDRLSKSQADFQNEQRAFNAKVQKALTAMGNMLLKTQKSMADADERPVVSRPRSVLSKSEISERFDGQGDAEAPRYTKSQTLDALTELAVKGEVPALVVSAYESSGYVDPTYVGNVNAKLKAMFG